MILNGKKHQNVFPEKVTFELLKDGRHFSNKRTKPAKFLGLKGTVGHSTWSVGMFEMKLEGWKRLGHEELQMSLE